MSPAAVTAARRALVPLGVMAVIFWFSAQPDSGGIDPPLLIRKSLHMGEYALLAVAWWWSLRPVSPRALPLAAAISLAYAASDEYHQTFVQGRTGSPIDVAIDLAGILLAAALVALATRGARGPAASA